MNARSLRQRFRLYVWKKKFERNRKRQMPSSWQRRPLRKALRVLVASLIAFILYLFVAQWWLRRQADAELLNDPAQLIINDGTLLNPISVAEIYRPQNIAELAKKLADTQGPVSIGGARKSMGGHIASPGSLHIDMRSMNHVLNFDTDNQRVTVEAGITWRELQDLIDEKDLSIQIMQTYSNFSVGGTLSVNAHGRYRKKGPVVHSVRRLRLVQANGKIVEASREKNPEIFFGAIGGYGGIGVIAEATLELTDNHPVKRITQVMPTSEHPEFFAAKIQKNALATFYNADLHPPEFQTLRAVVWQKTDDALTSDKRLISKDEEYGWTARLLEASITWPGGRSLRKYIMEPIAYSSSPVTTRNHEASYDIAELEPASRKEYTYALQEYFVPVPRFSEFVEKMATVFKKNDVEVVNVSVRHAKPDRDTYLSWAPEEVFAYVVYYRQPTTEQGANQVRTWTKQMAELLIKMQGTWYLPYQVHATRSQFLRAYPRATELFKLKKKLDPHYRFRGALWDAYYRPQKALAAPPTAHAKSKVTTMQREPRLRCHEARTYLSIPEGARAFQARHFADYLKRGGSASEHSWLNALRQYYAHEKRALTLAGRYPQDAQHEARLSSLSRRTAIEYLSKALYEATFGALFRLTGEAKGSDEAKLIAEAHDAYGAYITHRPWYEFSFYPWVEKMRQLQSKTQGNSLRRWERKVAFEAEFTIKAASARISEKLFGTLATVEEVIEVEAQLPSKRVTRAFADVKLINKTDAQLKTATISVPRGQKFTKRMVQLADSGVEFKTISGGGVIAATLLSDTNTPTPKHARALYTLAIASPEVSDASAPSDREQEAKERQVVLVSVPALGDFLRSLKQSSHQLEQLYDY